jgi:hypothetical protein
MMKLEKILIKKTDKKKLETTRLTRQTHDMDHETETIIKNQTTINYKI